jgi:hypothetical protein
LKKIIFLIIFLISTTLHASSSRSYSALYGFGELYNPRSYRVGFSSYEIILNKNQGAGVIKNFYSGNSYLSFSPFYLMKDGKPGIYGAVGYDYIFLKWFYIKMEFNSATSIGNFGASQAILGIGVVW